MRLPEDIVGASCAATPCMALAEEDPRVVTAQVLRLHRVRMPAAPGKSWAHQDQIRRSPAIPFDPAQLSVGGAGRRVAVAGIKVAHRIAAAPSLAPLITEEFVPGPAYLSDEELLEAARLFSQTIYRPTSTCRMGRDDRAVVDARLRVRGIEGLRVVDASIMPEIVSGNTNAPTIMIAEKAADMILEDARRGTAVEPRTESSRRQIAAVEV